MSLNETPSGERTHIGFFGARNAGKSSLVNAVTGQELAVVSDVKGTTTDPVRKAMELLPLGPVVIIDTPGFDDEGALGLERVKKTREILRTCDIAVLVVDAGTGMKDTDRELETLIRERNIPFLIVWNKTDLAAAQPAPEGTAEASSLTGAGITELKERLARLVPEKEERKRLFGQVDGSVDRDKEKGEYVPGSYLHGAFRDGNYATRRSHSTKAQKYIAIVGLVLVAVVLIYITKFYALL